MAIADNARREEAERLIGLASGMLDPDSEAMAILYLDHAAQALRAATQETDRQSLPAG